MDQALNCFQKQLKCSQEIGEKNIAWSNFNLAYIFFYKGELQIAADYAQEGLKLFQEFSSKTGLSSIFTVIGSIARGKGNLDESLEYYNQSIQIYQNSIEEGKNVPHSVCVSFRDLAFTYYHKNSIEEAIGYCKKALEIHKTLCHFKNTIYDFEIALVNFWLIHLYTELNYPNSVEGFLKEINQVVNSWPWLKILKKYFISKLNIKIA